MNHINWLYWRLLKPTWLYSPPTSVPQGGPCPTKTWLFQVKACLDELDRHRLLEPGLIYASEVRHAAEARPLDKKDRTMRSRGGAGAELAILGPWSWMVMDGDTTGWWFGRCFLQILGMSSSQLNFIFFTGVELKPTTSTIKLRW